MGIVAMVKRMAAASVLLGAAGMAAAGFWLQAQGIPPRSLAPYLEHRASGHNAMIEGTTAWVGTVLMSLDRGTAAGYGSLAGMVAGAKPVPATSGPVTAEILVTSAEQLRAAVPAARPGTVLTLLPGTYVLKGGIKINSAGTALAPITLRAAKPGTVVLESDTMVAFKITAPYWRMENLTIKGACGSDDYCEHALHITGGASHFVARNNTFSDFNAHFKINGENGRFPDHGLVENNTLTNTRVRETANPVAPIDLVAASHWVVRGNLITDFVKKGGNLVSYGAFAKGAGSQNIFERNVVICENKLRGFPGQRVGLSLGGGGTGKPYCRDQRCVVEQEQSVIRDNLIMSCSDEGMYLNSAAASRISHNTVIDTGGILVRFPTSSANLDGNLVDGAIRGRNGGEVRLNDNLAGGILPLYLGRHPQRALFRDAAALDFSWREAAPRRAGGVEPSVDLCGATRPAQPRYGAFEDFAACVVPLARP